VENNAVDATIMMFRSFMVISIYCLPNVMRARPKKYAVMRLIYCTELDADFWVWVTQLLTFLEATFNHHRIS
jgi:hypothetical protein